MAGTAVHPTPRVAGSAEGPTWAQGAGAHPPDGRAVRHQAELHAMKDQEYVARQLARRVFENAVALAAAKELLRRSAAELPEGKLKAQITAFLKAHR